MDPKVCVNCGNKNAVNGTDNRLVTESCGHVKCMQCLLQEVTGCIACQKVGGSYKSNKEDASKATDPDSFEITSERKRAKLERTGCVEEVEDILEPHSQSDSPTVIETSEEKQSRDFETEKRKIKPSTEHIITEKDGKTECYLCTLCRRKFSARSQVTYHAYCNGEKKPFECRECKKRFATRSHYNYHMQSKHLTNCRGRYICEICDASFIQKSKLQRHKLVIHTKEKKYACKECGKAFNNACSLRKHDLLHSGERPYMCPHCPRLFRDSSNLKKHINNKHSSTATKSRSPASQTQPQSTEPQECVEVSLQQNGRTHQCGSCPKAFHSGKDLRRHEKVHKDDKPFACEMRDLKCKQPRFRRLDNYNRHLRNTHGLVEPRPTANGQNGTITATVVEKDEVREKAKLEVLNPLPPLPEDFIQKHLYTKGKSGEKSTIDNESEQPTIDNKEFAIDKKLSKDAQVIDEKSEEQAIDKEKTVIDKSKIIEANTARQSVIVGTTAQDRKAPSPVPAYVHKIRKANSLSGQKVCLPPIDARKLVELVTLYPHTKEEPPSRPLDVGPLRVKDVETLKNILHDKADQRDESSAATTATHTPHTPHTPPAVHWRKKRLTGHEHKIGKFTEGPLPPFSMFNI